MQKGDRLLCAFIKPQDQGYTFSDWPLHVTLIPWFRLDLSSNTLATELRDGFIGSKTFQVNVQGEANFGYKKRKQVNLALSPDLMKLEGQSRRMLHRHHAWVVDEADHTRRGYHPHVTVQKNSRLQEGDIFKCDKLYIVEQRVEYKEVVAIVELGYGKAQTR